mgnify:CR=1 FL=1
MRLGAREPHGKHVPRARVDLRGSGAPIHNTFKNLLQVSFGNSRWWCGTGACCGARAGPAGSRRTRPTECRVSRRGGAGPRSLQRLRARRPGACGRWTLRCQTGWRQTFRTRWRFSGPEVKVTRRPARGATCSAGRRLNHSLQGPRAREPSRAGCKVSAETPTRLVPKEGHHAVSVIVDKLELSSCGGEGGGGGSASLQRAKPKATAPQCANVTAGTCIALE